EITSDSVSNVQIKAALRQAAKDVTKGITLSQSLSNHPKLFPGIITSIIKVGEESGTLDKAMTELKSFFEAELKNQLRIFSSMIEPILTLFIGVVIAFAVLSLISPIYQIVGDVSKG
ncbi:MAG: type II secretion system F domain-containing protein, partial [Candidatus Berkelbacteria bacterium Licking1014_2]